MLLILNAFICEITFFAEPFLFQKYNNPETNNIS